jgi:uncharacterized protein with HEPN domain
VYLEDMVDALAKIRRYVRDMSYDDFCADDKTQDAVIRNLEIIGEGGQAVARRWTQQASAH